MENLFNIQSVTLLDGTIQAINEETENKEPNVDKASIHSKNSKDLRDLKVVDLKVVELNEANEVKANEVKVNEVKANEVNSANKSAIGGRRDNVYVIAKIISGSKLSIPQMKAGFAKHWKDYPEIVMALLDCYKLYRNKEFKLWTKAWPATPPLRTWIAEKILENMMNDENFYPDLYIFTMLMDYLQVRYVTILQVTVDGLQLSTPVVINLPILSSESGEKVVQTIEITEKEKADLAKKAKADAKANAKAEKADVKGKGKTNQNKEKTKDEKPVSADDVTVLYAVALLPDQTLRMIHINDALAFPLSPKELEALGEIADDNDHDIMNHNMGVLERRSSAKRAKQLQSKRKAAQTKLCHSETDDNENEEKLDENENKNETNKVIDKENQSGNVSQKVQFSVIEQQAIDDLKKIKEKLSNLQLAEAADTIDIITEEPVDTPIKPVKAPAKKKEVIPSKTKTTLIDVDKPTDKATKSTKHAKVVKAPKASVSKTTTKEVKETIASSTSVPAYVINPSTKRKVKVGSETYHKLIKDGILPK